MKSLWSWLKNQVEYQSPASDMKNWVQEEATPSPFRKFFESLDLNSAVDDLLNYFDQKVEAKNLIWVLADSWEQMQQSSDYLRQQLHAPAVTARLRLCRPAPVDEVRRIIMSIGDRGGTAPRMVGSNLVLPVTRPHAGEPFAFIVIAGITRPDLDQSLAEQMQQTLLFVSRHLGFCYDYWLAKNENLLDDLTGLYNQRYLGMVLDGEVRRSRREQKHFSVLFIDIDFFKSINDQNGHWVGSQLLIEFAKVILGAIRGNDYAFRYGGDEYVIVLPETELAQAQMVAERLRQRVADSQFSAGDRNIRLTVSIGLAGFPEHAQDSEGILKMADQAMYYGKNKSRNVVYMAS